MARKPARKPRAKKSKQKGAKKSKQKAQVEEKTTPAERAAFRAGLAHEMAVAYRELSRSRRSIEATGGYGTPRQGGRYG